MTAYADEPSTDGLNHLQATALAAAPGASLLYTRMEVINAITMRRRVYALTRDHKEIVRLHTREAFAKREWAGYWVGATSVPVVRR